MSAARTGALLEALRDQGCRVFGLEYADAGLELCRKRGLEVQKFHIGRSALPDNRTFDVAISMEVAEHLPESSADPFVAVLTELSNCIVFTAAHPGRAVGITLMSSRYPTGSRNSGIGASYPTRS